MKRILPRVALFATALLLLLPSAVVGQSPTVDGVLFGVRNDVALTAGQEADAVIVIQGTGRVEGAARAVLVIDGEVTILGSAAQVEEVIAISSTVQVGLGASVGQISQIDSAITVSPGARLAEPVRDISVDPGDLAWIAGALGAFFLIMWIGWGIAVLVAGLFVAGLASAQVRRAGWAIGRETLKVIGVGLLAIIFPPLIAALLMATVVGIPLGIGLLFVWGLIGFLGYLVVGIWLGERILRRQGGRPYAAAFLGILILLIAGIIPLVSFIVWWIGLGAVTLDGWRVLRRTAVPAGAGMAPPYVPPPGYWGPGGGWAPPPDQGWGTPQQPGWGQPPGWGPPPDQGWGTPQQPGWGQPPAPGQGPEWGPPRRP
jgi:hypothetical protein